MYIYPPAPLVGAHGCEAFDSILYPVSFASLYPCIYILLFLYLVCCMLDPVSWMPVSCMLHVVSCILDVAIWLEECGTQIIRITLTWAVSWNPGWTASPAGTPQPASQLISQPSRCHPRQRDPPGSCQVPFRTPPTSVLDDFGAPEASQTSKNHVFPYKNNGF